MCSRFLTAWVALCWILSSTLASLFLNWEGSSHSTPAQCYSLPNRSSNFPWSAGHASPNIAHYAISPVCSISALLVQISLGFHCNSQALFSRLPAQLVSPSWHWCLGLFHPWCRGLHFLNTEISVGPVIESVCQDEGVPVVDSKTAVSCFHSWGMSKYP